MTTGRAIAYGTLVVGVLDAADAVIFFGASPTRIFQSIAAGLLGRTAAFSGGLSTAALGAALHFFIAFAIVSTFVFAARRMAFLTRRPILSGLLYGLAVYAVMNYVVVPLSAAGGGAFRWPVFVNGVLIHMFGVGVPASLFARAAVRSTATATRADAP